MTRLTKRLIDTTACPPQGEAWLPDDTVPGFGVRLRAGRKIYSVRYRTVHNQLRRHTLGLTTAMTLEQARTAAQDLLHAVRQGQDPAANLKAQRQALTLDGLAARYLETHVAVHQKPRSAQNTRLLLSRHILPALGTIPIEALSTAQVTSLHHQLRAIPITANRCLALLSHMCTMAERWGLRPPGPNPVRGVARYRERSRERFLTMEELARLGTALRQAEVQRTEPPTVIAAIRLLLLTGARLREILTLEWLWIDWERGLARLPDSKTGPKLLRLPGPALDVLRRLPRAEGQRLVLPGRNPAKPLGHPFYAWRRLCQGAGLEGVRLHDLRHTYASMGVTQGLSLPMVGAILGHQTPVMTQRYAHFADDPVQAAVEVLGQHLARVLQAGG